MKLTYEKRYAITQPLLKQEFSFFENEIKKLNLQKDDILQLITQLITDETHGFTSYLTPSLSVEVLYYLEAKFFLDFSLQGEMLFEAISLNDNTIIKWFLERIPDINIQDEDGNTPLHVASKLRYSEAYSFHATDFATKPWELTSSDAPQKVEIILSLNPNPHLKNKEGKTALDVANENKNYLVAKVLSDFINERK